MSVEEDQSIEQAAQWRADGRTAI